MTSGALGVAWYRFRATFGRRWPGYLSLILLIGLVGGLAMGAVAAARRTQSSFPAFLKSTDPSDFSVGTAVYIPGSTASTGYNPPLVRTIAHLPHVARVESNVGIDVLPLGPGGEPVHDSYLPAAAGNGLGSVGGESFNQDRLVVIEGRMANPGRADEVVMFAASAHALGLHVGSHVPFAFYTNAQTGLPGFGTASVPPFRRVDATLVGVVASSNAFFEDDIDSNATELAIFTPTLTRQLLDCCVNYAESAVKVAGGAPFDSLVESEIAGVLPKGDPLIFTQLTATQEAKAQRSTEPESIALAVFGGIAGVAALLIAGQVIGRLLRLGAEDSATLQKLGAAPATIVADALIGIMASILLGSLLAVAVAIALSPLAPFGPIRPVYPFSGVAFDGVVLGYGAVVLIVGTSAVALVISYRWAPHRASRLRSIAPERGSAIARSATASGLALPAVTGIRFALEPGRGRNTVPVRSAILGAAMAMIVVVATVTFGDSLSTLVSTPHLYGWNWDYALVSGSGVTPGPRAANLLDHDKSVASWSGYYFGLVPVDGENVPVLGGSPGAPVQPPVLSGHGLQAADQVVLGAVTLSQLHKRVGDTVKVGGPGSAVTTLTIVGTATMPTVGNADTQHLEMGTGALLSYRLIPESQRNLFGNPFSGPGFLAVDLRSGGDHAAAAASLKGIARSLSNPADFGVAVLPVARPAEIVNYRSDSSTSAWLGAGLGAGAVISLALTLVASVRRRRRDLALLRTLGFTGRQLQAALAWQSSIAVGLGILVGVPLGIIIGRTLWDVFAEAINAVPQPTVPAGSIALVALGALVLANLIAAVPGRLAARTPTALLLRAE